MGNSCVCDPIEDDGYEFVQWVGTYLGACVYSPRDQLAFWLGLANIFLWLFAQAPQIYANYRNRTAESLSGLFLLTWLLGDATNLIGCILTQQLPTQLYTAIYFIFIDCIMLSQYAYYMKCKVPKTLKDDASVSNSDAPLVDYAKTGNSRDSLERSDSSIRRYFSFVLFFGLSSVVYLRVFPHSTSQSHLFSGRVLLDINNNEKLCNEGAELSDTAVLIGSVCAWLSGFLYFTARFPQIYTNYKRQATEGLSLSMFVFSTTANVFYTLSVVVPKSTFSDMDEFYESTFPYLLGSGGTILSTIPILYQFYKYRKTDSFYYLPGESDSLEIPDPDD